MTQSYTFEHYTVAMKRLWKTMENSQINSPDYSQCTIEELEDVLKNIDKIQFPQRYIEAKAMLSNKRDGQTDGCNEQEPSPAPRPKWSEQLLITRLVTGSFCVMTLLIFSTIIFHDFIVTKSWTTNTKGVFVGVALIQVAMWFACIVKDKKFSDHLMKNWRGKSAIVIMPIIFVMCSWLFFDKSLPSYLHMLSPQEKVRYNFKYEKQSAIRHCNHRIKIIETNELEGGNLCMSENQRKRFSERGDISVYGTRSKYG